MTGRAQMRMLPDGRRLHLQDGPIDLIVEAFGATREIEAAYCAACTRFVRVLDELCGELSFLRQPCSADAEWPRGYRCPTDDRCRDALCVRLFHHANGCCGGCGGRRHSRCHARRCGTLSRLRQRRRRYRAFTLRRRRSLSSAWSNVRIVLRCSER